MIPLSTLPNKHFWMFLTFLGLVLLCASNSWLIKEHLKLTHEVRFFNTKLLTFHKNMTDTVNSNSSKDSKIDRIKSLNIETSFDGNNLTDDINIFCWLIWVSLIVSLIGGSFLVIGIRGWQKIQILHDQKLQNELRELPRIIIP